MEIQELKQYIIDNNKIETILSSLGCHHISNKGKYFTCARPTGDNPQSIVVYCDNITVKMYTGERIEGDLISLVMGLKNIDFIQALKWIHKELGLEWSNKKKKVEKPKYNPLDVFTSKLKSTHKYNVNDIEIYDEMAVAEFADCIHKDWVKEGITEKIRKEFHLGYDFQRHRIIIPWKSPYSDGYVGVVGRTTIPMFKDIDIPKYWNYITGFKKNKALYGFQENYKYIQEKGYCVIFEAEKSTLKRASLNDRTGLSIGSHTISDEQIKLILSLNVDVIIAFDKDIDIQEIREDCEKFWLYRNVYYIYDRWNLMKCKDSPADMNNKTYEFLFKYKVKYDEAEHNKFLKGNGGKYSKS